MDILKTTKFKILLFGGVVLAFLALLALGPGLGGSIRISVNRSSEGQAPTDTGQDTDQTTAQPANAKLSSTATTFGGTQGKPEFSIRRPTGWIKNRSKTGSDLYVAQVKAEKLPNGDKFHPNINAAIAKHSQTGLQSF